MYTAHVRLKHLLTGISAFALMASVAGSAHAQVVPGSAQPERVEERFRNHELTPSAPSNEAVPSIQVPQTAIGGKLAKQFTLDHVEIEGVTVYKAGTFDGLFKNELGKTVTLAHAREIARGITTRYRNDGYVLSQAVIPNQDLTTGTLKIRVVEGFVDKVLIENDNPNRDRRNLIAAYAEKIKNDRPLNTRTLERYMLLITDLPGVTARAIIKPSPSTFGAADLTVQVRNKGVDASATLDNRGNKYEGPLQAQLTATENSLAGLDERTTIRGINTIPVNDLHFWDVQHEEQIGTEGTRLVLLYANTLTNPGGSISPLSITGTSDDYSISLTHPFLRSRAENFTGRLVFDARDTENDALGIRLSNDRVRALRAGGNYDTGDRYNGVDMVDLAVSQGTPWIDATQGMGTSRTDASDSFTKFNADLSRLQNLPHGFSFLTAATGQYSAHPLVTSEQMSLGGVGFGQAYDSGEIAGDSGIAGRLELRYGQPVGQEWFNSYQLYTYYDIGAVYLNDQTAGAANELSLASAGVGVRTNFTPNFYGYGEVGFPLTREVASEGNNNPRVFFSITGRY